MHQQSSVTTFLFSDIEGSTQLWEQQPERMRVALARHDAIARTAVEEHRGVVVKMSGDGVHAAFDDPLDAVSATLQLQQALADPEATSGVALRVRCGLHAGVHERRDNDFFGGAVNRAARIMCAAHGGQILVSQVVAALVADRLPAGVSLRDLGNVRLRDLASPERVHQIVHPELRQDFPALRSLEAIPNNLPLLVTSFVGRERELLDIQHQLRTARLLTLLGAGGLGKTRLSVQVAGEVIDDYPDGAWFVDLAPITDERLVAQAVASVLGVKEETGRPVIEALVKYVSDRRPLLILDNCEHLLRACADLAKQLLQAGPRLKILTSSREPLHVAGETTIHVPPLSIPELQSTITAETITQFEAVRLFVDRAHAVQPEFQLTDENASAVAEICHRLDGIPLALELAAARVRALSVTDIAGRLSDRFRLLARGDRTALPRQQTLRASIDWSYELLTEAERTLLRRLAVFAGGWTLEAVEAVGTAGSVRNADVLDLLTNLVEKSLVAREAEGSRYRLLETLRQYAWEKLDESDDRDQTYARHLQFYMTLAEQARPLLVGPEQGAWLGRLDLEHENFLAAFVSCERAEGGAELGLRLVSAVKRYWLNRGLLGLGYRVTVEALLRAGSLERTASRCRTLFDAGQLAFFMGNYEQAKKFLEESLAIARDIGDRTRIAAALQALGMAYHGQSDMATARKYFEEALALAQALGNKRDVAAALNAIAQLHRVQGALDIAEPLYGDVVALARELGDRESIAFGLLNLAMVAVERGRVDAARTMLLEVLDIADEVGSKRAGQSALEVAAGLGARCEDWQRAARLYGAAETQTAHTGLRRDPSDEAFLAPLMSRAREALGAREFVAAEIAGRALVYDHALAQVREWLESPH